MFICDDGTSADVAKGKLTLRKGGSFFLPNEQARLENDFTLQDGIRTIYVGTDQSLRPVANGSHFTIPAPPPDPVIEILTIPRNPNILEREFYLYWILRACQTLSRNSWEEGLSDEEMHSALADVLANAGFDPADAEVHQLHKRQPVYTSQQAVSNWQ